MRILSMSALLMVLMIVFQACDSDRSNGIPNKAERAKIEKGLPGVWELMKRNYEPSSKPALVTADAQEVMEIDPDGTFQTATMGGKWFLTYSDQFIFDSTSKVIFQAVTRIRPDGYGSFDRDLKSYQVKLDEVEGKEYLYFTSLQTSVTRIYIRKS